MSFLQKLSDRNREALRVFFFAALASLVFVLTPAYKAMELEFYDLRLLDMVDELDDSGFPLYPFQKDDKVRAAGFDDARFLNLIKEVEQLGAERVIIFGSSLFENYESIAADLPDIVSILDEESVQDKLVMFQDHQVVSELTDRDGNLRRIPWGHPSLELGKELATLTGAKIPNYPGDLRLLPLSSDKSGADFASTLLNLEEEIQNWRKTGHSPPTVKGKTLIVELGTTTSSKQAEVVTSIGRVSAGEIQTGILRAILSGWVVRPCGPVLSCLVFLVLVGGFSLLFRGRRPLNVASAAVASLYFLGFLSYELLPNGLDAPIVAWMSGLLFASLFLVVFEIQRSRKFLKDFGGAEDAQFEGEESEASMVFTNLPNYLLDMEKSHDQHLLKYRRDYNEVLAQVAVRYHGKVLDFQGDAQMLGFGLRYDDDNEHAAEATAAAIEIVQGVQNLAEKWGVDPVLLRVHAGVCTGSIALGHLGAEQKQDIAAIGDTTNTAARLMGAAMKCKRPVLVAKSTFEAANGLIDGEELPPVELKGKSAPVEVFAALEVDTQWRIESQGKQKDLVPSGGTLVYRGSGQSFFFLSLVFGFIGLILVNTVWKSELLLEPELRLFDFVHRRFKLKSADPRIVIVGIDDESLGDKSLGGFPWSRGIYAQAIRNLSTTDYKGVFVDVMFKSARANDPQGDRELAAALAADPRVVVAGVLYEDENTRLASPKLFPAADYNLMLERNQLGLIHKIIDDDGLTRKGFLSAEETASHSSSEAHLRHTFPSAAAALLLREDPSAFQVMADEVRLGKHSFRAARTGKGRTAVRIRFGPPATAEGSTRKPEDSYEVVPFRQLMDPQNPVFGRLKGRYILVGPTMNKGDFKGIDQVETIVGRIKGVEVHARVFDSLLNGDCFHKISRQSRLASFILVGIITQLILTFYREPRSYFRRLALLVALLGLAYLVAAIVFSWLFELILLWLTVITVTTSVLFGRYLLTFRALSRVIPEEVAKELLFHNNTKDRRQIATILLTDIRGYTTLSEGRTAVAMLDVLNEYHKRTVACYDRFGGQALTYQGDAQIVVFGVFGNRKNPAADGAAAALELQSICDNLREEWGIESRDDFDVGAGLCTGEVEIGLLGGGSNLQYSVVGETVRKAHKVQSLSAELEAPVILDEETYEATKGAVQVDDLGMVQPKGLAHEIRLYRAKSVDQD